MWISEISLRFLGSVITLLACNFLCGCCIYKKCWNIGFLKKHLRFLLYTSNLPHYQAGHEITMACESHWQIGVIDATPKN